METIKKYYIMQRNNASTKMPVFFFNSSKSLFVIFLQLNMIKGELINSTVDNKIALFFNFMSLSLF